jgi:hypothetical protein
MYIRTTSTHRQREERLQLLNNRLYRVTVMDERMNKSKMKNFITSDHGNKKASDSKDG